MEKEKGHGRECAESSVRVEDEDREAREELQSRRASEWSSYEGRSLERPVTGEGRSLVSGGVLPGRPAVAAREISTAAAKVASAPRERGSDLSSSRAAAWEGYEGHRPDRPLTAHGTAAGLSMQPTSSVGGSRAPATAVPRFHSHAGGGQGNDTGHEYEDGNVGVRGAVGSPDTPVEKEKGHGRECAESSVRVEDEDREAREELQSRRASEWSSYEGRSLERPVTGEGRSLVSGGVLPGRPAVAAREVSTAAAAKLSIPSQFQRKNRAVESMDVSADSLEDSRAFTNHSATSFRQDSSLPPILSSRDTVRDASYSRTATAESVSSMESPSRDAAQGTKRKQLMMEELPVFEDSLEVSYHSRQFSPTAAIASVMDQVSPEKQRTSLNMKVITVLCRGFCRFYSFATISTGHS